MKKLLLVSTVAVLFVSTAFASESLGLPKGQCLKGQASQERVAGKDFKKPSSSTQDVVKSTKSVVTRE